MNDDYEFLLGGVGLGAGRGFVPLDGLEVLCCVLFCPVGVVVSGDTTSQSKGDVLKRSWGRV